MATESTPPNEESTEGVTPDVAVSPVEVQPVVPVEPVTSPSTTSASTTSAFAASSPTTVRSPGRSPNLSGFALAALILGIVAFMVGLVPVLGIILGAVAVALGVVALLKKQRKGLAVTGLALGGVALLVSLSTTIALGAGLNSIADGSRTVVSEPAVPDASVEPEAETPAVPNVPAEYASALDKADSYANMMHMSKAGLYDQLTSEYGEQFSAEVAQYAVDNVVTDWNANALAKAQSYQDDMSMAPAAIHDQLTSEYGEQFTAAEADYAIANLNN